MNQTFHTPAPAQVTTTVQQPSQPHSNSIEDTTFRVKDIQVLLAIIVALVVVATFVLNRSSNKRKEESEASTKRADEIKDAIKLSHDDAARDVRELTDKVKDGRTVMEKDIQSLAAKIDHERKNREMSASAVSHLLEKTGDELRALDRRMTTQEEKSRAQDATINEVKALIREKFDETKELVKAQGEAQSVQFKELANSIREARDAKFKT